MASPTLDLWPPGFPRTDDGWLERPVDELARGYDALGAHGWYANLDPTVEEVAAFLGDGHVVVDYSGGTGLLADRLLERVGDRPVGILNVDASAKFLRLAWEKHGSDPRTAFRLIRYQAESRRLEALDEVVGLHLLRGVAAIVSANAIHLYYDLEETLRAWRRVLRPGGRAFVQSGNIAPMHPKPGEWIIDETVHAIAAEAKRIVADDERYARYRPALVDTVCMESHDALRKRYFLPVRPLRTYLDALVGAGFEVLEVEERVFDVDVGEWMEFLGVYHDGIVGWMGGTLKVEGTEPTAEAVADRLRVLREAADRVFASDPFQARWTYITAQAR